MTTLNDTQRSLLEAAAAREDGFIDIEASAKASARALVKKGLFIATPQEGSAGRYLITSQGRAAVRPAVGETRVAETAPPPVKPDAAPGRAPNKTEVMIALLTRPEGVTVEAMSEATGWLPHSVRGFMAGTLKKKLGMTVMSEKIDGVRIYRASAAPGA